MREASPSHWLRTVEPFPHREPLDGSVTADVAVLGAGFTGLRAALSLLDADPTLDVVIVEQRYAGFGASGRNGGWVTPHTATGTGGLIERFGRARARELQEALHEAVNHVGTVATDEGIDARYARPGRLLVARGEHQRPALERVQDAYERTGFGDRYQLIDRTELSERIRVAGAVPAQWSPICATSIPLVWCAGSRMRSSAVGARSSRAPRHARLAARERPSTRHPPHRLR